MTPLSGIAINPSIDRCSDCIILRYMLSVQMQAPEASVVYTYLCKSDCMIPYQKMSSAATSFNFMQNLCS